MNTLTTIVALAPLVNVGGSMLINWLLTMVLIVGTFLVLVWCLTKIIGPPNIPENFRWILWCIVAVGLIIFLFAAFGVHLP